VWFRQAAFEVFRPFFFEFFGTYLSAKLSEQLISPLLGDLERAWTGLFSERRGESFFSLSFFTHSGGHRPMNCSRSYPSVKDAPRPLFLHSGFDFRLPLSEAGSHRFVPFLCPIYGLFASSAANNRLGFFFLIIKGAGSLSLVVYFGLFFPALPVGLEAFLAATPSILFASSSRFFLGWPLPRRARPPPFPSAHRLFRLLHNFLGNRVGRVPPPP